MKPVDLKLIPKVDLTVPDDVRRLGTLVLWTIFVFSLVSLSFLAWKKPLLVPAVPLFFAFVGLVIVLFRHPLLNLTLLLAGIVIVADYEPGIQAREVLYGLYYFSFLGHFFFTRLYMRRERLFERPEEKALIVFIVGITLSIGLTILFDGDMKEVVSQWSALVLLLLYFPVKEALVRYRNGPIVLLGILAWIGVFAAVRNLLVYQAILSDASQMWQVARNRVITNDGILMVSSLAMLATLLFANRWRTRLPLMVLFLIAFAGLILTQSRGFWVAFVVGALVLFFISRREQRIRLVTFVSFSFAVAFVLGFLFFKDYMLLIIGGLADRFGTLETALTDDVSLVNRFIESGAVFDRIKNNPIMGYGMGVPFRFYDMTFSSTRQDTFIHNGYLSLWYRFGIWGLGLVLIAYGASIARSFRAMRAQTEVLTRVCGTVALVALIAYSLPAITSNPFHLNDGLYIYGVLFGIAGGAAERARQKTASDDVPLLR